MNERPEKLLTPEALSPGRVRAIRRLRELDAAACEVAAAGGLQVGRARGSWVSYRGHERTIVVAPDDELDDDDCLLQIVLHELCHWMVQGEAAAEHDDWGLNNQTDDDEPAEHAALVLQRSILMPTGLQDVLEPTTDFRAYYRSLLHRSPADAVLLSARAGMERWMAHPCRDPMQSVLEQAARLYDVLPG